MIFRRHPRPAHPLGHFYSPIVDTDEASKQAARIWPESPQVLGIDFNDDSHRRILTEVFPRFIGDYDYPDELPRRAPRIAYYNLNSQFGWLDARALFVLLREWRPRRVIEVGSGYSSLLINDVNARFFGGACEVTCIEPYPREFLQAQPGLTVVEAKVQEAPLELFATLDAGDVLFIDSSHVAKTGSDVNWLYFEVLPRLKPGVRIHVHDIFLPHDYPQDWVIKENRSWNEQYVLQALLMHSNAFRVLFGSTYAFWKYPELVRDALALADGRAFGGCSIWFEKR